jgi:small subunit ribosomal protein S17
MAARAVAGLCGGARSRPLQGAVTPAGALCMKNGLAATVARLWQGAAGGAAAFHTTAPCEVRMKMRGTVVGDKAQKTVVVAVERTFKHPVVKKYVKERSKFMAHDELDQYKVLVRGRGAAARPAATAPCASRGKPAGGSALACFLLTRHRARRWGTRSGSRSTAPSAGGSAGWCESA